MFPHLHRLVSGSLVLLLTAAALLVGAGPASAGEGGTIKRLANAVRADVGLDPLAREPALDGLARKWAYTIAADGSLSHNPDLAEQVPEGWQGVGENVAMGYPTGTEMHRGWMGSEGHRANILGDYTHIGIAFVVVDGTSWGVQVFAKYPPGVRPTVRPKATPEPAASASAEAPAPRQPPRRTKPTNTATPTPSRTPSAVPSASPSGPASVSESTPSVAGGDSETAGAVTFTDSSDGPAPASSGLFGIGVVEVAIGVLGLSTIGLLAALFLGRRRRERWRREMVAEQARSRGIRPARTHPAPTGPLSNYPVRTYPVRTHPAQTHPAQTRPVRPSPPPRREW